MKRQGLAVVAAMLVAAAAPAVAQDTAPAIDTTPESRPGTVDIANEGAIRNRWTLDSEFVLPAYPDGYANARRDVCIALGYQIGADGTTSDFRVLQQWNSETAGIEPAEGFWSSFAMAGVDAVKQWKFKPRPEMGEPRPVFTVATLTWKTRSDTWPRDLRAHCEIDHLAAWIRRYDPRYDMNDHLFDRAQRANESMTQAIAGTPRSPIQTPTPPPPTPTP
jgi:hypothetical protein